METILKVLKTLETIRVSGKEDMNRMLGCIVALEGYAKSLTDAEKHD